MPRITKLCSDLFVSAGELAGTGSDQPDDGLPNMRSQVCFSPRKFQRRISLGEVDAFYHFS